MGTGTTFAVLVTWVIAHGYFLFFIAAFLEGPLVTAAAGVAAALGYYSLPVIIFLSVMGDLTADVVYYTIGYVGRRALINRYGQYIGLTKERVERLERFLKRNVGKTMLVVKLSPVIPVPGIIVIGSSRVSIKRFAIISLLITVPKSLIFAFLGFYSGRAYEHLSTTITNGQLIFFGVVVVVVAAYLGYKKLATYISNKLEHNKKLPL